MWRLYIGGLSHSVTQKDLKDRFGKFGDVEDVELRTRRDEDGVPYKTFGYINIRMSEANRKKCLTVLNKSKWKGGTLQIEAAKESFLHRLARERQVAAEQHLHQPPVEDKRQKMIDSLSKAGVKNFTMKSGVPGTEIPGNKNWVVSKFGRVLPILQLRCRKGLRVQTVKYDPSKYSHNIRKLDGSSDDQPTPIAQLTWELKRGDDDISKKRRGEFPPFEPSRPKTIKTAVVNSGYRKPVNHRLAQKMVTDSDIDSDEEIRRMVAAQDASHTALRQEVDEDNLEVVGLNYSVRSDRSCEKQKGSAVGNGENDYDSTDTDELLTSKKPPLPLERLVPPSAHHSSGNCTNQKIKLKRKHKSGEDDDSSDEEDYLISWRPSSTPQREDSTKQAASLSEFHIEDKEELESADSDYDAMVSNVTHLEISLADLQRLAEESQHTSETTAPTSSKKEARLTLGHAPKKGTTPEEILASLLEEDSSEDEQNKKNKKGKINMSVPLPTFQGTRALREEESERGEEGRPGGIKKQKLDSESPQLNIQKNTETEKIADRSEETEDEDEEDGLPSSSSVSSEEDEDEQVADSSKDAKKATSTPTQHSMSSASEEEAEEAKQDCYRLPLRPKEEEERQRRANMRRLAAIQQRQKKAEEHKMLIQGALAKPDATTAGAGKHIVFGSDEEENDSGEKPQTPIEVMKSKKMLFEDSQSEDEASPDERGSVKEKLFSGSGGDDDEDGSRFVIRSQFEGPAGQKLMELQSRFGTDERFRMDSRFKNDEDDDEKKERKRCMTEEEEALDEERKKNLSILQSVLDSSQQICCSKMASKARTFRDVSALHYDPSREEHTAFETSTTENKESKSARRLKKEEAQKHPEVSMEIYYDVFGDLKAAFGPVKDKEAGGEEKTSWDQLEEERVKEAQTNSLFSANVISEKSDSSGFKFSFFGDNTEMGSIEAAYKVESIQTPNMCWKQDQLIHGSSSEDDDQIEDVEQSSTVDKTKEQEMSSKTDRFFFFPDDIRLTEGPRLFCRSSHLEEQRELWQEKRNALRQEYRKKHKNAKRKLKSSQNS